MQVNVHEAKTQLSKLLEMAESGEEVIIARNGKPAVRLEPVRETKKPNVIFGMFEGQGWIADDFDDWTPELEEMFYGGDLDD